MSNIMDETLNITRNVNNGFITISGNTIGVNAAASTAVPSFRYLIIGTMCHSTGS